MRPSWHHWGGVVNSYKGQGRWLRSIAGKGEIQDGTRYS